MKPQKLLLLLAIASTALCAFYLPLDDGKLPTPQLSSPSDGAQDVTSARMSWGMVMDARKYRVNYKTDMLNDFNPETSSTDYTIANAQKGVRYTWRVKALANDPKDDSDWSSTRTFIMKIEPPAQLDPADGAKDAGTLTMNNTRVSVTTRWKAVDGAVTYVCEVEGSSTTSPIYATEALFPILNKNQKYRWRVKAIGKDVHSAWSPWWSFTTKK